MAALGCPLPRLHKCLLLLTNDVGGVPNHPAAGQGWGVVELGMDSRLPNCLVRRLKWPQVVGWGICRFFPGWEECSISAESGDPPMLQGVSLKGVRFLVFFIMWLFEFWGIFSIFPFVVVELMVYWTGDN